MASRWCHFPFFESEWCWFLLLIVILTNNTASQPFWSSAIHRSCIGPAPIQEKDFSTENLVDAVRHCMRPETREAAQRIGRQIQQEDAVENAVNSFHSHLDWDSFRCSVTKTDPAIYQMRAKPSIKLSAVAAAVLTRAKAMRISELELYVLLLPISSEHYFLINIASRIKRQTYIIENGQEALLHTEEKEATTFDEVKSVSRSLMKAIVKPTISHISDAYNSREVRTFPRNNKFIPITKLRRILIQLIL
jgi:hypothetical protein